MTTPCYAHTDYKLVLNQHASSSQQGEGACRGTPPPQGLPMVVKCVPKSSKGTAEACSQLQHVEHAALILGRYDPQHSWSIISNANKCLQPVG